MIKTTKINKMVSESINSLDERGLYCLCLALARSVDRLSRNKTQSDATFETDTIAHHIKKHKKS
jgi:hypothetical protein